MVRIAKLGPLVAACACGPVQVEYPDLLNGMKEIGSKLDDNRTNTTLVDHLAAAEERVKALESTNAELEASLTRARAEAKSPYALELECDAASASQSEITTSIGGARASSVGCPAKSGRIALHGWTPGESRLHVELHVGNDTAAYNGFAIRLWHGTENVWMITRGNPMGNSDGCKQGPDHHIDCAFDDPFPVEPTRGKVRLIDRDRL